MSDEQWRQFFLLCNGILGKGDAVAEFSESWCAWTTFERLSRDAGYWTAGLSADTVGKKILTSSDDLTFLWRIHQSEETEPEKVGIALRERIKELNCLYGISQLADRHSDSIDDLLQNLVNFLPLSWQYPDITCSRIVFKDKIYKSKGFKVTKWRQSSQILLYNEPAGEVAIFYLEERPAADEGPFLKEERALLDAVAERISTITMRIAAERELQEINKQLTLERKALQETNAALRAVLARIEEEKRFLV